MLENFVCWGIALGLMFSSRGGLVTLDYTRLIFALCFIFAGAVFKAIYTYKVTHTIDIDVDTDENGNIVVSKMKE